MDNGHHDMLSLIEQPLNKKVEVCKILSNGLSPKLTEMGLFPGRQIEIVFRAPLGDPIAVDVDGTLLSLRLDEAALIKVKCIDRG